MRFPALKIVIWFALCAWIPTCSFPMQGALHSGAENPLLDVVGKPYSEYSSTYNQLTDSLFSGDSLARAELLRLVSQAAAADPSGEWQLNLRLIEGHVRFYESRDGGFVASGQYTAEDFAADLLATADEARRKGFPLVRLTALFNAADVFRIFAHEYERAFACYLEAAEGSEGLSQRDYPLKPYIYQVLADFYYSFREYGDAAVFYRKIVEDPESAAPNNHRVYYALNGLGLCYGNEGAYDLSDSCFRRILELSAPVESDRKVWEGIAEGNIGHNHFQRGDTDSALMQLKHALQKMERPNDASYTSRLAANIAHIYLQRDDVRNGKRYLDMALDLHAQSRVPAKSSDLLGVMARYYTLAGDRKAALACLDSALMAKQHEDEAFSGLVLRRVEQQLREADRKFHERQFHVEKQRNRTVTGALAVILALLMLTLFFYRRLLGAYRKLVRRNQNWAGVYAAAPEDKPGQQTDPDAEESLAADDTREDTPQGTGSSADEQDRIIMEQLQQAIEERELYKIPCLTLDMLAAELGYSRHYISRSVNRCARKNLLGYLNEYRVKEAIRIMSDNGASRLSIDAVAADSGFNDRKSFHRIFKQFTGLSPSAFRDNIGK